MSVQNPEIDGHNDQKCEKWLHSNTRIRLVSAESCQEAYEAQHACWVGLSDWTTFTPVMRVTNVSKSRGEYVARVQYSIALLAHIYPRAWQYYIFEQTSPLSSCVNYTCLSSRDLLGEHLQYSFSDNEVLCRNDSQLQTTPPSHYIYSCSPRLHPVNCATCPPRLNTQPNERLDPRRGESNHPFRSHPQPSLNFSLSVSNR